MLDLYFCHQFSFPDTPRGVWGVIHDNVGAPSPRAKRITIGQQLREYVSLVPSPFKFSRAQNITREKSEAQGYRSKEKL